MPGLNKELVREAADYGGQWLAFQQKLHEIPGISVAIRHAAELILSEAYGFASLEERTPVTPEHIFRVASHSKWFTAVAVFQLKEQGKLRLDDSLGQYISWLRGQPAAANIRQALNHATGITRDGFDNNHWQLEQPFPDAAQLRRLVEEGGDVIPPDHKLKYSNVAYSLLGLVVEKAAGVPYNRFVQENIVDRLGLRSTGPETNAAAQARLVTGYTGCTLLAPRIPLPDISSRAMSAATGFYSTAEDLTRFAVANFFGNDELTGDASKREMQRPYWAVEGMDSYGLGMMVTRIGDRRLVGHSGGFPGHSTRTLLDASDKLAVSVLTNESNGRPEELAKGIVRLIDLSCRQDPAPNAAELDRYTGRFGSMGGYVDIVRLGDQLFELTPSLDDPAGDATKLTVVDEQTLQIEEREGYGSPGEFIRYEREADGAVARVIIAGSTNYPEKAMKEYLRRRRAESVRSG